MCHHKDKLASLVRLLSVNAFEHAMIFCNTKALVAEVVNYLDEKGFEAVALHGDMEQREREQILIRFKHHSTNLLVATDVAARGLDIDQLPHVVNYDLPNVAEDYVHRIGRTGRAGNQGTAISLVCNEEKKLLQGIQRLIKKSLPEIIVDGYEPVNTFGSTHAQEVGSGHRPQNKNAATEKAFRKRRGGPAGKLTIKNQHQQVQSTSA